MYTSVRFQRDAYSALSRLFLVNVRKPFFLDRKEKRPQKTTFLTEKLKVWFFHSFLRITVAFWCMTFSWLKTPFSLRLFQSTRMLRRADIRYILLYIKRLWYYRAHTAQLVTQASKGGVFCSTQGILGVDISTSVKTIGFGSYICVRHLEISLSVKLGVEASVS